LSKLGPDAGTAYRDEIVKENFTSLIEAVEACARLDIRAFRIVSQIIPLATHPDWRFDLSRLNDDEDLAPLLRASRNLATAEGVRLSMHPDQFVVLSSPKTAVVNSSLAELEYQAAICEAVHADVLNIHGGGAYGNKPEALDRFRQNADRLSDRARSRLTVENDDRTYSPEELLPLCKSTAVPLVYDVHHHRCLPDSLSVAAATEAALATWDREPHFHISSPKDGWSGPKPHRHHDYVDAADFPQEWRSLDQTITVDVEAKAKELAVRQLCEQLRTA
jgi:UV DNA damage endonuclease